jgi:hypothetical protein
MTKEKEIPVLDSNNTFLSYTTSAKARILLKKKEAIVFNKHPFMIKLKGEKGENQMAVKDKLFNLRKYLKDNEDVYIQNISNTQVSLRIVSGVNSEENILIPKTNRPICLTKEFSSTDLMNSADFRKIMNRRPPILVLMSEEEYLEWHEKRSRVNGTDLDFELSVSADFDSMLTNPHREQITEDYRPKTIEEKIRELEESNVESVQRITPRVSGLLAEVSHEVPKEDKMKCDELMLEFEAIESSLTKEDYQEIAANGYYKRVRNWASKHLDAFEEEDE